MNNVNMKKIATALMLFVGLAGVQALYAAGTGKEKVAIKISAPKGAVANDKIVKKLLKGVPFTPCIAGATTFGAVAKQSTDSKTTTFEDTLLFTITASDVSSTNPLYFYLIDPSGQSHYSGEQFKYAAFVSTVATTSGGKKFKQNEIKVSGSTSTLTTTDYLAAGTSGKAKVESTIRFDGTVDGETVDEKTGIDFIHAAQGTWLAVAFIADGPTPGESVDTLLDPKNWLAFDARPFVVGRPVPAADYCEPPEQ